jgi:hypothetical protein
VIICINEGFISGKRMVSSSPNTTRSRGGLLMKRLTRFFAAALIVSGLTLGSVQDSDAWFGFSGPWNDGWGNGWGNRWGGGPWGGGPGYWGGGPWGGGPGYWGGGPWGGGYPYYGGGYPYYGGGAPYYGGYPNYGGETTEAPPAEAPVQ